MVGLIVSLLTGEGVWDESTEKQDGLRVAAQGTCASGGELTLSSVLLDVCNSQASWLTSRRGAGLGAGSPENTGLAECALVTW